MTTFQNRHSIGWWCALLLGAWLGTPALLAAGITEPATVIYGKIVRTDAPRPYLVTEGTLTWTIRRADGVDINLKATLAPLNGGEFSYRLDVPHDALVSGLNSTAGSLPLRVIEEPALHTRITVNGKPAAIIGEVGALFSVSQLRRAATYRLDLMVSLDAVDADGNGLPDWWEKLYGKTNPAEDSDGDGWSNLAEFRNGGDPAKDNRIPTLETREAQAYAENTSAIRLRAIDSDSSAANLTYTLEVLPEWGTLYLRNATAMLAVTAITPQSQGNLSGYWREIVNPSSLSGQQKSTAAVARSVVALTPNVPDPAPSPDRALGVGATFTQADVDQGRLVYVHTASSEPAGQTRFEVTLRDEDPAHAAFRGGVTLFVFRPSLLLSSTQVAQVLPGLPGKLPALAGLPDEEQAMTAYYLMGREQGYLITDVRRELAGATVSTPSSGMSPAQYSSQYVSRYGVDHRHLIIGSPGADRLVGGMEGDVLISNGGRDALRGNGGSDLFLFNSAAGGASIIEDFNLAEHDILDVSRLLTGTSTYLSDYLKITTDGVDSFLGVSTNGTRGTYSDFVITIRGTAVSQTDLYALVEAGSLRTGSKGLTPLMTISAPVSAASENGPQPGLFVIHRGGDTSAEVQVNVLLTGSAQNGIDYRLISTPLRIPAGQNSATVVVTPIVDALTEGTETVEAILQAGTGYVLGGADRAVITIEDLAVQVRIEAIEPVATVSGLRHGAFLITRSGLTDRSVLVRLDVKGSAANYTDYEGIPSFVNIAANQTTAIIEVVPKATAVLTDGAEFVTLGIRPDASYLVLSPSEARVVLLNQRTTIADWRQRNFPSAPGTLTDFSRADTGGFGIANLYRYAFGMDPLNPGDPRGMPAFRVRDGRLTVDFRRPVAVPDVQYVVEVSDDLINWDSSSAQVEQTSVPAGTTDADLVSFQARRAATDARPCFMRVRVVLVP